MIGSSSSPIVIGLQDSAPVGGFSPWRGTIPPDQTLITIEEEAGWDWCNTMSQLVISLGAATVLSTSLLAANVQIQGTEQSLGTPITSASTEPGWTPVIVVPDIVLTNYIGKQDEIFPPVVLDEDGLLLPPARSIPPAVAVVDSGEYLPIMLEEDGRFIQAIIPEIVVNTLSSISDELPLQVVYVIDEDSKILSVPPVPAFIASTLGQEEYLGTPTTATSTEPGWTPIIVQPDTIVPNLWKPDEILPTVPPSSIVDEDPGFEFPIIIDRYVQFMGSGWGEDQPIPNIVDEPSYQEWPPKPVPFVPIFFEQGRIEENFFFVPLTGVDETGISPVAYTPQPFIKSTLGEEEVWPTPPVVVPLDEDAGFEFPLILQGVRLAPSYGWGEDMPIHLEEDPFVPFVEKVRPYIFVPVGDDVYPTPPTPITDEWGWGWPPAPPVVKPYFASTLGQEEEGSGLTVIIGQIFLRKVGLDIPTILGLGLEIPRIMPLYLE